MDPFKNTDKQKIVLFSLEEPRYALYLSEVVKVERAVEITPLPGAPQVVSGVINVHGEIIPVIDIRKLFRLPQRDIHLDDHFIIARTSRRLVALEVDSVNGVYDLEHLQAMEPGESSPFTEYLSGIAGMDHGIVLITDLERFLSLEEERVLDLALAGGAK
ncbi:MAG TPA: chemotaxis protein CheW [Bacteroidetes bacterium]|nr:chemotaxis protein CheW [Bacteroidota bacterium]